MKKIRSASLKIGKVIHDELKDLIDIYPLIAPANTTGTFAIYKRNSLRVRNTKDVYDYEEIASVEISIISQTYLEGVEKAINVKMYMEHLRGEYFTAKDEKLNINDFSLVDCSESWSGDMYVQTLRFDIILCYEPD